MKTAKQYREQAIETLRGNWKSGVISSLIMVLIYAIFYVPSFISAQVAGESTTITYVLMVVSLVGICFIYFPFYIANITAYLRKIRGSEHSILEDTRDIFVNRFKRILEIGLFYFCTAICMAIVASILATAIVIAVFTATHGGLDISMLKTPESLAMITATICIAVIVLMIPVYIYYLAISPAFWAHEDYTDSFYDLIKRSRYMMRGHKWQLFCLYLSFIGWMFLGILTLGIGYLWLMPYTFASLAHFYEDVHTEYEAKIANTPIEETRE